MRSVIFNAQCENDWNKIKNKSTTKHFMCMINNSNNIESRYKRLKNILSIVETFNNRDAVKWYFRFLSGAIPQSWQIKRNGSVQCNFCKLTINNNFIEHILLKCKKLESKRKRSNIIDNSYKE